jgi:hypothetical protein
MLARQGKCLQYCPSGEQAPGGVKNTDQTVMAEIRLLSTNTGFASPSNALAVSLQRYSAEIFFSNFKCL